RVSFGDELAEVGGEPTSGVPAQSVSRGLADFPRGLLVEITDDDAITVMRCCCSRRLLPLGPRPSASESAVTKRAGPSSKSASGKSSAASSPHWASGEELRARSRAML